MRELKRKYEAQLAVLRENMTINYDFKQREIEKVLVEYLRTKVKELPECVTVRLSKRMSEEIICTISSEKDGVE